MAQPIANQSADAEAIKAFVLSVVSEKTGYPVEVLALDLDLEADLGIDTVKQAELFASIRTQYGIARREDLRLSDYNTLAKVIAFVKDSLDSPARPAAVPVSQPVVQMVAAAQAVVTPTPIPINPAEIKTFVLAVVSEKTGYPPEVLDLDLDLEADLGIDTVKQAELFAATRLQYGITRREDLRLSDYNTLAKVIRFVEESLTATLTAPAAEQPVIRAEPPIAAGTGPVKSAAPLVASFEEIKTYLLSAVSEKTGYPQEVLDLDLDLEADLGIDTVY
jgi:acyl carrier protein